MGENEEIVIVKRKVYEAALEVLVVSDNEKEDPKLVIERIVKDCRNAADEAAAGFWSEVQAFLAKTGVSKPSDLLPLENMQPAYAVN
jgi:hypothetical protein